MNQCHLNKFNLNIKIVVSCNYFYSFFFFKYFESYYNNIAFFGIEK